jgi:hypothetical protein
MTTHWSLFRKFIRAEQAAGGPDGQFTLMLEHAYAHYPHLRGSRDRHDQKDLVWLIGCYGAHHCAMPAYEIFDTFTYLDVIHHPKTLRAWLKKHWRALPVRPEMRSHRMLEKRHQCLVDFAQYANTGKWHKGSFEKVWTDSQANVKYYGRYMAIKVLELMHRTVRPDMPSIDIRAKHAWSPRAAMALLYPKQAEWLGNRRANDDRTIAGVELYASEICTHLLTRGITVSFFELQVLLCEYKELLAGGFYPGAGHDEEMKYLHDFERDFDPEPWYVTRKRIFEHKYLGELNGWDGLRPEEAARWKQMSIDANLPLPPRGHGA